MAGSPHSISASEFDDTGIFSEWGSEMKKQSRNEGARARKENYDPEVDDAFSKVTAAFKGDREVAYGGGKGFGSKALRVNGKLFAMISSKGKFVAKLPRQRVDELVRRGIGEYFDTGSGRLMKEWLALGGSDSSWIGLAKEARHFVAAKE
jgi:hypothetical protein